MRTNKHPLDQANAPAPAGRPQSVGARAVELEDWLNRRLYHPASWRLAKILARTPVTPNAVSVMAGACVVGAACLYAISSAPAALWGALGLMMAWHVVDGADGDLARMTGRVSELGEIIDGACDYLSHFVLYGVLAVIMAREWGIGGFVLMGAVGCARAIQTVFYETQRRQYLWWCRGVTWLRIAVQSAPAKPPALQWAARCYLAFGSRLAGGGERIDTQLARIAPDCKADAQALIQRRILPQVQRLWPLSSNYRSLVIGGAMIAGRPEWIIAFELVALSLVMIAMMGSMRRAIADVADQIGAMSAR